MDYQILSIIDDVLGDHKEYSRGEYYYHCPLCNHYKKKLAVNIIKKKWHCWKCGERGSNVSSLLWKVGAGREQIQQLSQLLDDYLPTIDLSVQTAITLPSEYLPLYKNGYSSEYRKAKNYLVSRGLTNIDIEQYEIGYCPNGDHFGRVIIPSYTIANKLNYYVARAYNPKLYDFKQPQISKNIIGLENHINFHHDLVICEGIFDAMAIRYNAVPLFGKFLPKKLRERIIVEKVKSIYLALDNDALNDTLRIADKLMKENINVYVVQLDKKDPSVIGFDTMTDLIKTATPLTFTDLIYLKLQDD